MNFRIDKGLDIPVMGAPEQKIDEGRRTETVALLGRDHIGLRPVLKVSEGDRVRIGQPLFVERKHPGIAYTSPGGGTVREINRGDKRRLLSVVVALDDTEDKELFPSWPVDALPGLGRARVVENLLRTGLWTALRTRPYDKVPDPASVPRSVFVTATDTNPLSARPEVVIGETPDAFIHGLEIVAHLTEGPLFVCKETNTALPQASAPNIQVANFWGPHPAGLPGTHIHFLDPVNASKSVWHLNYQDVIAIGKSFTGGHLWTERIVALAGPEVTRPRLLRTRLGADIGTLSEGERREQKEPSGHRIISGSLLSGRAVQSRERHLGRFHNQIAVLAESPAVTAPRQNTGWRSGLRGIFSAHGTGAKPPARGFPFTTAMHGGPSAMLPFVGYDRVMPLDILAAPLLRALIVGDTDTAQSLGCLELGEDDLALLTFMCPGKFDYGPLLLDALARIEKEG